MMTFIKFGFWLVIFSQAAIGVSVAETVEVKTEPSGASVQAWVAYPKRLQLSGCLTPCRMDLEYKEDSPFGYTIVIQKDGYLPFEFRSDEGVVRGIRIFEQHLMSFDHAHKAEKTRSELAALTDAVSRDNPEYLEAMTRHYMVAHTEWNDQTYEMYKDDPLSEAPDLSYQDLLDHYCWPGVKRFGATYGSRPDHHPEHEKILSSVIEAESGTVWTVNRQGDRVLEAHHRFRYKKIQGHWYLESVDYRDDDGAYLPIL
jgi:hypothetical protein